MKQNNFTTQTDEQKQQPLMIIMKRTAAAHEKKKSNAQEKRRLLKWRIKSEQASVYESKASRMLFIWKPTQIYCTPQKVQVQGLPLKKKKEDAPFAKLRVRCQASPQRVVTEGDTTRAMLPSSNK